jgi:cell division protein FtsI (penicillin-binding protein 3)
MSVAAPPRARSGPPPRARSGRGSGRPPARRRPARPRRRPPNPRRRLEFVLIATLMVLSVIGGRLIQLQGLDRSTYARLAEDQRLNQITLTAVRGDILDRDGNPLAETVDARDVVADPTQVVGPDVTARTLAPVLNMSASTLVSLLTVPGQYSLLKHAVTPAQGNAVLALNQPGIATPDTTKRIYPDGSLASNIVGRYTGQASTAFGLEGQDEKLLAGRNGTRIFEVGVAGDPIPDGRDVLKAPVPGTGIKLTLDSDIQYEAQRAIAAQVQATRSESGTVIVMNPSNGQILAMATAPGFDPNHITSSAGLGNPAVTDSYEPGSVMKGVTMSAALQEGLVTPTSKFVIPPSYSVAGSTFRDAETHGTEHLTLTGILAQSSNIGAIKVGQRLGSQRLIKYVKAFGFGRYTGAQLPGESPGNVLPLAQWSGTTLPTLSFGQGIETTALQVASAYATIADNGVRVTPTMVEGHISSGRVVPSKPPSRTRVVSASVAREMRDMLQSVTTEEGTAPEAQISGYQVAGKTGTANQINPVTGQYFGGGFVSSFIGMVPAKHPKLICEVVLEKPKTNHFGGSVAGPVFHKVMSFALQSLGIAPSRGHKPTFPLHW